MYRQILGAAAAAAAVTNTASASIIELSQLSSDETPASLLSAIVDFDVSGTTLTITVTNNTSEPNGFSISALYFNAGAAVLGLTPVLLPDGWNLHEDQMVGGFGIFDYGLIDDINGDPPTIMPGDSQAFSLTIAGSADKADFVGETAEGSAVVLAAKFVQGPDDDSAFGATLVPTPGAVALLGMAAVTFHCGRRRR